MKSEEFKEEAVDPKDSFATISAKRPKRSTISNRLGPVSQSMLIGEDSEEFWGSIRYTLRFIIARRSLMFLPQIFWTGII